MGQTGTTVAPDVYIAVGISGAVQHVSGIGASKRSAGIDAEEQAPAMWAPSRATASFGRL